MAKDDDNNNNKPSIPPRMTIKQLSEMRKSSSYDNDSSSTTTETSSLFPSGLVASSDLRSRRAFLIGLIQEAIDIIDGDDDSEDEQFTQGNEDGDNEKGGTKDKGGF